MVDGGRDVYVIGASAGGVTALQALVTALPDYMDATLFVVVHRTACANADGLVRVLRPLTHLFVSSAVDGGRIQRGHIYVAPGDSNLVLDGDRMRLQPGLPSSPTRSGIDTMFRSAAACYGGRVVAVLLSGTLDDGTSGLWDVHDQGGVTIVQEPSEARFPGMPLSAITNAPVHHCLRTAEIAAKLVELRVEQRQRPLSA